MKLKDLSSLSPAKIIEVTEELLLASEHSGILKVNQIDTIRRVDGYYNTPLFTNQDKQIIQHNHLEQAIQLWNKNQINQKNKVTKNRTNKDFDKFFSQHIRQKIEQSRGFSS